MSWNSNVYIHTGFWQKTSKASGEKEMREKNAKLPAFCVVNSKWAATVVKLTLFFVAFAATQNTFSLACFFLKNWATFLLLPLQTTFDAKLDELILPLQVPVARWRHFLFKLLTETHQSDGSLCSRTGRWKLRVPTRPPTEAIGKVSKVSIGIVRGNYRC